MGNTPTKAARTTNRTEDAAQETKNNLLRASIATGCSAAILNVFWVFMTEGPSGMTGFFSNRKDYLSVARPENRYDIAKFDRYANALLNEKKILTAFDKMGVTSLAYSLLGRPAAMNNDSELIRHMAFAECAKKYLPEPYRIARITRPSSFEDLSLTKVQTNCEKLRAICNDRDSEHPSILSSTEKHYSDKVAKLKPGSSSHYENTQKLNLVKIVARGCRHLLLEHELLLAQPRAESATTVKLNLNSVAALKQRYTPPSAHAAQQSQETDHNGDEAKATPRAGGR